MEIVPQFAGSDWLYMALSAEALGAGTVDLTPHTLSNWVDFLKNAWILPDALRGKTTNDFAERALSVYKRKKKYDTIVVGPPSGSIIQVASLLNAPYLASEFWILDVAPISAPAHDSMLPFIDKCMTLRKHFLESDKNSDTVLHFDPIHNRTLDMVFANFEAKMTQLPKAYDEFIKKHLRKDGSILLNNCQYRWPQYTVDERTTIQIGGYGGITPLEYETGSKRIDTWLSSQGSSHKGGWSLPYSMTDGSETEWGINSKFISALTNYCDKNKYALHSLNTNHPYSLSEPLLSLYPGKKLFVDTYWNLSPRFTIKTGNPSLWSVYSDTQSKDLVEKTLSKFDYKEYYLSLYPAEGPDIPTVKDWTDIFPKHPTLLGVKELPMKNKMPALNSIMEYRKSIKKFKKEQKVSVSKDDVLEATRAKLISS